MIPWWIWAIFGAVLALAEMHVPGGYLIWIALGAAMTSAVSAAWNISIEAQLAVFATASALSCAGGYFVYRGRWRVTGVDTMLNERTATLVGARGVVSDPITNGIGKIRLGDSVWIAEGPELPTGTPVVVRSVLGSRVRVERDAISFATDTT